MKGGWKERDDKKGGALQRGNAQEIKRLNRGRNHKEKSREIE